MELHVKIINESGLHARPAALFIKEATKYKSKIWMIKEDKKVDAKSILSVLSLGIHKGMDITLQAEGVDSKQALQALKQLIMSGFGEE